MKLLFYLLTAAAHPFGLYVVVPLYMEHCYVVTGSDGAGRAMAAVRAWNKPFFIRCLSRRKKENQRLPGAVRRIFSMSAVVE